MIKKRYAIVRVDNSCPAILDDFGCIIARNILHCKCGEDAKNYGDTKEQLIIKIKQVITRVRYAIEMGETNRIADDEGLAKEIVEFLGVEE